MKARAALLGALALLAAWSYVLPLIGVATDMSDGCFFVLLFLGAWPAGMLSLVGQRQSRVQIILGGAFIAAGVVGVFFVLFH